MKPDAWHKFNMATRECGEVSAARKPSMKVSSFNGCVQTERTLLSHSFVCPADRTFDYIKKKQVLMDFFCEI